MNDMILLKPGELVLKGLNRHFFEDRLRANVARRLRSLGDFRITSVQSTIYVEPLSESIDMEEAFRRCHQIFGIIAVCRAAACPKEKEAIARTAVEYLGEQLAKAKSFKVESKRSDKTFPMTSIQLSQYVGGVIGEAFPDLPADMHHPDLEVNVEIREQAAYVHAGGEPAAGGLPVGTCGRAVSLLSGGIDSPVSTWMIARRGVQIIPVHFFSFPYTSELAKQKVLDLARLLLPWCGRLTVEVIPFTHIQEEIRDKCPEPYFTLIMRRFMMRLAQEVALANGCGALVTGENLGQVASQTMEALRCTEAPLTLPVLRPLIGMDKEEIIRRARELGTFETSILPYEDCCTVFTPKHPRTRPTPEEVEEAEAALDVEALIKEALAGTERVQIKHES
ncbi:MAG: tRNA 4-thiouridine(8) synthase ThiI [Oscillospiraceae bacterium]|nr:tRNA 4-thiouridine(8) synthase ThiI [Oscillospiraceae bacterium]